MSTMLQTQKSRPYQAAPPEVSTTWTPLYVSPAEQRYDLAVELAFQAGRDYQRAADAELARLGDTWRTDMTWETNVARRAATYGPGRPLVFDDPEWPPVAIPGGGS